MSKTPPVPTENQSPKGSGDEKPEAHEDQMTRNDRPRNLEQQGRHGNIHQNTHHQGYQQDR